MKLLLEDGEIDVDLQAENIDPVRREIKKGSQTTVRATMSNMGPDNLPVGEAKVMVTINGKFLNKPSGFKSPGWKLETINKVGENYGLFCVNTKEMGVNEDGFPGFQFAVRGKAPGTADITLASTLSATATSSDVDGSNQSVRTEIIVTK